MQGWNNPGTAGSEISITGNAPGRLTSARRDLLRPHRKLVGSMAVLLGLAGCANMNATQKGAVIGGAGGAGLGAVIGHQFGSSGAGAVIGGLAGTAAGALGGNMKDEADRRDAWRQQAIYERQRAENERYRRIADAKAISNSDIITMTQANVPDSVIVRSIQERGGRFDTSPQGLITLGNNGVSSTVMQVMQRYNSYR